MEKDCPSNGVAGDGHNRPPNDPESGAQMLSYKGALDSGFNKDWSGEKLDQSGKGKGKKPESDAREASTNSRSHRDDRFHRSRDQVKKGGRSTLLSVRSIPC